MLSTRQLRYFEVLAETLHFGRAARRLNISQPALSAQIAQMEALFGGSLFERRPEGVVMTSEGVTVRKRVQRIMVELRDLEALAAARQSLLTGRLKLGLIASVAPYLIPRLLPALAETYPDLMIGVQESVTAVLLEELAKGELDCVVLALPAGGSATRTIDLLDEPFFLAVPQADAGRLPSPVSIRSLRGERLILLEEGHCLREQALTVCEIADAGDLASLGATSLATLLKMVAGGLGVTLVPEMAVEPEPGGIAFLPFEAPVPRRRLALAYRASSGRGRDFETLAEMIRACLSANASSVDDDRVRPDQPPPPG